MSGRDHTTGISGRAAFFCSCSGLRSHQNLHRPLSCAQDDRGNVRDVSTTRRSTSSSAGANSRPTSPASVTDDSDRSSLRSDLERNRFVTFVMDRHEASESTVRDGMRSNPAMPASHTAEPSRCSWRRETDRARALTSRTSRQNDSDSVSSVLTSASAARTASVTSEPLRSTSRNDRQRRSVEASS
jgi:hypothetical protein